MIIVTKLMKNIEWFDPTVFTKHKCREALIDAGYHENDKGWFSNIGKFIAIDADRACLELGIEYESIEAHEFALVDDQLASILLNQGEIVLSTHGVWVWGLVKGQNTTDDIEVETKIRIK